MTRQGGPQTDRLPSIWFCRFACPGEGLPPEIVQDMFSNSRWTTQEGIGLSICRKILKLMGGEVQYIRESERSFFHIVLELPQPQQAASRGTSWYGVCSSLTSHNYSVNQVTWDLLMENPVYESSRNQHFVHSDEAHLNFGTASVILGVEVVPPVSWFLACQTVSSALDDVVLLEFYGGKQCTLTVM